VTSRQRESVARAAGLAANRIPAQGGPGSGRSGACGVGTVAPALYRVRELKAQGMGASEIAKAMGIGRCERL
jgi:hypothetical protein